jgi:hypothetical protein
VNPTIKDIAQILAWIVAILAGAYGIHAGVNESRENRALEQRQLRWERASLARDILEKLFASPRAGSRSSHAGLVRA